MDPEMIKANETAMTVFRSVLNNNRETYRRLIWRRGNTQAACDMMAFLVADNDPVVLAAMLVSAIRLIEDREYSEGYTGHG